MNTERQINCGGACVCQKKAVILSSKRTTRKKSRLVGIWRSVHSSSPKNQRFFGLPCGVVETDYAEEIPTCRDLALRPFLLSEKSEIFRVAMRGRRNGLRGRNPDKSGFGAPSVPPLRKIRDFSGCHAGWSGGGHILRRLNEWLAESCKLQVSGCKFQVSG